MEKTYCCFNATARDFAKLGQLLLNDGNWYGKQILDSAFVQKMVLRNKKRLDQMNHKFMVIQFGWITITKRLFMQC